MGGKPHVAFHLVAGLKLRDWIRFIPDRRLEVQWSNHRLPSDDLVELATIRQPAAVIRVRAGLVKAGYNCRLFSSQDLDGVRYAELCPSEECLLHLELVPTIAVIVLLLQIRGDDF